MREIPLSRCEKEFVNTAVAQEIRLDARELLEARDVKLHFGATWGKCLASLGRTKILANISCDIQPPKLSRPNEGMIHINVELNPLAAPFFEATRQSEIGVLLTRHLERCFKDSRCVDLEALCIVADKKVWNLRVDINVINHDGNLVDCASIAILAALLHFHRPDVTSTGDEVIVHSFGEKDPLPLTLFHQPVCVSFTTFDNGKTVMDPTFAEERLGVTQLTLGLNAYKEICCLHFDHTTISKVSTDIISCVINDAVKYSSSLIKQIKETVKMDVEARYRKEESKAWKFKDAIAMDKITSMMRDRVHIRVCKWTAITSCKNNMKMSQDVEMTQQENVEAKINKIGEGSAELVTNTSDNIGEGGKSSWQSSDEDMANDDEENDIEFLGVQQPETKILDDIELSDSEEETIGVVSSSDLQ